MAHKRERFVGNMVLGLDHLLSKSNLYSNIWKKNIEKMVVLLILIEFNHEYSFRINPLHYLALEKIHHSFLINDDVFFFLSINTHVEIILLICYLCCNCNWYWLSVFIG